MTALGSVRASARTTFASLQEPNYRRFLCGQSVSLVGTWMQRVAQSWLVLEVSGSGTAVGLVVALQALPVLVGGPYGGVVADRVDKRRLILFLQVGMGALALTLGVLVVTGAVALWQVFALALLLGLATCFENPARQSFILEMVGPEHLRNAVSLTAVLVNVARMVGPAVAGVLIAAGGTGLCFLVNAATFAAVVLSLATMDTARLHPAPPTARAPGQLREGLQYVRRSPGLAVPLAMMALVGCLAFEFQIVLPVLAQQTFAAGGQGYGFMTAAMGAGAIIGGLAVAARSRNGPRALVVSAAAFGLSLAAVAAAPSLELALVGLAVTGAASVWFQSTGSATLQLNAAPSMRGRVMALWTVAFLGSTPIGGPIAGFVADRLGGRAGLLLGAVACLVAAGLGGLALRRTGRAGGEPGSGDPGAGPGFEPADTARS